MAGPRRGGRPFLSVVLSFIDEALESGFEGPGRPVPAVYLSDLHETDRARPVDEVGRRPPPVAERIPHLLPVVDEGGPGKPLPADRTEDRLAIPLSVELRGVDAEDCHLPPRSLFQLAKPRQRPLTVDAPEGPDV